MIPEEDYLLLSGIQHFAFCRRQWALIHIEQQWKENLRTVEGNLLHENSHDSFLSEKRSDLLIIRGMRISSASLGVTGECDVVEFRADPDGAVLAGRAGRWQPYPIEYKHGKPKEHDEDILQLCCQAICLEEMLACRIPSGALYYGETRRRQEVLFSSELKERVNHMICEMHELYRRGYTPKVRPSASCNACSLKELCLPKLCKNLSAGNYISGKIEEEEADETSAEYPVRDD